MHLTGRLAWLVRRCHFTFLDTCFNCSNPATDLCLTSRRDLRALSDVLALSGTLGLGGLEHPFGAFKSSY
ncbi:hypothetical protein TIFTF001_025092 [Ficus carica]|uniref:Uncharacterized protein n=1 Tax=Ficus carica TaxID=3494 RepID=A0AA88DGF3_FICCA|nr:hypothetical protein TIFTF001_025092 [Ficus carica]